MRQGERLPAPAAVDVTVHTDPRGLDSFAECADKALEGSLSEPPDKRENINSKTAPTESEAATSLDLNVEAGAQGLALVSSTVGKRAPRRFWVQASRQRRRP